MKKTSYTASLYTSSWLLSATFWELRNARNTISNYTYRHNSIRFIDRLWTQLCSEGVRPYFFLVRICPIVAEQNNVIFFFRSNGNSKKNNVICVGARGTHDCTEILRNIYPPDTLIPLQLNRNGQNSNGHLVQIGRPKKRVDTPLLFLSPQTRNYSMPLRGAHHVTVFQAH